MADQSGGLVMMREYRKGNWTLNETMVLIEAKKMDDERRMRRSIGLPAPEQQQDSRSGGGSSSNKPAELRWKWIEDYCWRKGCMRSQNQCNDKWDNLMRDYKKVREYERRRVESSFAAESSSSAAAASAAGGETVSYWKMEKSDRKERNLPSNMLPQTYQALFEVVESKTLTSSTTTATALTAVNAAVGSGNGGQIQQVIQQSLGFVPTTKHHQMIHQPPPVMLPLPPQPLQPQPRPLMLPPPSQPPQPPSFHAQPILPTKDSSSDSDKSDSDTSPAKRRRTMPTTTAGPSGGNAEEEIDHEAAVAAALSRSASVIANAIKESEERQDKRHQEVMSLQERRLKIEESNVEMNRQGMNGLVEAINKLATSIFTLASSSSSTSSHHQGGPSSS